MSKKRYRLIRNKLIRRDYQLGLSVKELVEKYKVAPITVYRALKSLKSKERHFRRLRKMREYVDKHRINLKKHKIFIYGDKIFCIKNGEEKSLIACKRCIFFCQKEKDYILCCFSKVFYEYFTSLYLAKNLS